MNSLTVLVPTFGRTQVLEECIQSFLLQATAVPCNMIVLNDHPEQRLYLNAPGVRVINVPQRFSDLGTKRQALLGMASGEWVTFWDDDDIYLPSAIERLAQMARSLPALRPPRKYRAVRESHCWQVQSPGFCRGTDGPYPYAEGLEMVLRDSGPMWALAVEADALRAVGGFPAADRKQDVIACQRIVRAGLLRCGGNTPGMPGCIHRLADTPYVHAVDYTGPVDNASSSQFHAAATASLMDRGEEPRGEIHLTPRWRRDYVRLTTEAWQSRASDVPRRNEPPT